MVSDMLKSDSGPRRDGISSQEPDSENIPALVSSLSPLVAKLNIISPTAEISSAPSSHPWETCGFIVELKDKFIPSKKEKFAHYLLKSWENHGASIRRDGNETPKPTFSYKQDL